MSGVVGLAIIGAGPAGMAAAIAAREHGADVLVLDEQAAPGGQIYRNVETVTAQRPETARVLGGDYAAGAALVRAFRGCGAEYSPRTSVWEVSTVARREDARVPLELGVLRDGVAEVVRAHCVIVASGAQERAVPVPGATLPGVMGAGGAQSLLKGAGLVPDVPVVIAGSGPLVYLVAWQLVRAGAPVRLTLRFPATQPGESRPAFSHSRPSGRVELRRDGNTVDAMTRGVRRFTLLLSADQFDFSRPIRVTTNGVVAHDAAVSPDAATLLRWAAVDWDRTALFSAELAIEVAPR